VDRIARRRRILHAQVVLQVAARQVVIEGAGRSAGGNGGLESTSASAIEADITALVERAALGGDIDNAGRAVAILCGKRAGYDIDRIGKAWIECLTEAGNAFG